MTIHLFDLTDASHQIFFSPYCWRVKMAMKHKGLSFKSIPWHFTDTDKLPDGAGKRVPVIVDGTNSMGESSDIAAYLDKTYTDRPTLMADAVARARARFMESWCNASVFATMRPIAVMSVFEIIAEKDRAYFRESRERMLNAKLEALSSDPQAEADAMNKALGPANDALTTSKFLGGDSPDYSDYILFGTLMWPYMVCKNNPLDMTSSVGQWFDRMLDLHDGFARTAPRAADAA